VTLENELCDVTEKCRSLVVNNELHLNPDAKAQVMNELMGNPKFPAKPRAFGIV